MCFPMAKQNWCLFLCLTVDASEIPWNHQLSRFFQSRGVSWTTSQVVLFRISWIENKKSGEAAEMVDNYPIYIHWAMHSDEQMITGWPFSPLNDEQMSKKVRVEHHRENPVQNVNLQKAGWFVRESPPVWGHHLISKWRWITFPRTYPSSSMNSSMSLDVEKLLQWVKSWDESEDFELGESQKASKQHRTRLKKPYEKLSSPPPSVRTHQEKYGRDI